MCVSKVSPTEESGQEGRHSLSGGSGEPGKRCAWSTVLPMGSRGRQKAAWRLETLLRAEMKVPGVLAVVRASSAIKIVLHHGFRIFCLFFLSLRLQRAAAFSGMICDATTSFIMCLQLVQAVQWVVRLCILSPGWASSCICRCSDIPPAFSAHLSSFAMAVLAIAPSENSVERGASGHGHSCPIFIKKCS